MRSETSHGEPAGGLWLLGMCFFFPPPLLFIFFLLHGSQDGVAADHLVHRVHLEEEPAVPPADADRVPRPNLQPAPRGSSTAAPGLHPEQSQRPCCWPETAQTHTHTQIISQLAASSQLITPESGALRSRSPELAKSRVRAALKTLPASQPRAAAAELSAGLYGRV